MKVDELSRRVAKYAVTVLSPKAREWTTKFAIGMFVPRIPGKVAELVSAIGCVGKDDEVDVATLHEMISSGFKSAGHLSLFGGIVGFDPHDADELFDFVMSNDGQPG